MTPHLERISLFRSYALEVAYYHRFSFGALGTASNSSPSRPVTPPQPPKHAFLPPFRHLPRRPRPSRYRPAIDDGSGRLLVPV